MARPLVRPLAGAALVAALALVAAGCGSSKAAGTAASGTTTTASRSARARSTAFRAFRQCLQRQGVTLPRFGSRTRPPGAGSRPRSGGFRPNLTPAQQRAFAACRSTLGTGGFGFRPGGRGGTRSAAFARYTACLRSHGVTFGKTANAQTFQKAQKACAKYRPSA